MATTLTWYGHAAFGLDIETTDVADVLLALGLV